MEVGDKVFEWNELSQDMQNALRDKVYQRGSEYPLRKDDLVVPIQPYPYAHHDHGIAYLDSMDKLLGRVLQATQTDNRDGTCRADRWWWSNHWLLTVDEYQEVEELINPSLKVTEQDAMDILNLL